jgi:hypothetical protein
MECPHKHIFVVDMRLPTKHWECEWCGQRFIPMPPLHFDDGLTELIRELVNLLSEPKVGQRKT